MTCSKPINYKQLIESNRYSNKENEAQESHHDNHELTFCTDQHHSVIR